VVPCAHTCLLPHTPSTAFAFALGRDPWSYLALSCAFLALHLLLHSVRILVVYTHPHPPSRTPSTAFAGSGSLVVAPCTCLPSPTHSQRCCACLPSLAHSWCCICFCARSGFLVVVPCACLPSPTHSWPCVCFCTQSKSLAVVLCACPCPLLCTPMPCRCKRAGQVKGSSKGHLPPLEHRDRTG
jgi:hypothetical protein